MNEIHRRWLNSCLVIGAVIALFISVLFMVGAGILFMGYSAMRKTIYAP